MKKTLSVFIAVLLVCATVFCFTVSADASPKVFVLDKADVIHEDNEATIRSEAERIAAKTGFNIVVLTSADIGTPKTDAHTVEYADDTYEELCGKNTDGILLLINCDTKYDYISTSGSCINYFSDARIDAIFDRIGKHLSDENFAQAAYSFVLYVEKYYDNGKANYQQEVLGLEFDPSAFASLVFPAVFICIFVGVCIYAGYGSKYKIKAPETRNYILDNSLAFDEKSDTFIGNNVRTVYTPRSSSSSGRRSGSHHSSTHHSHSGGRHGGGGRHR